jgi:hypothetical protein
MAPGPEGPGALDGPEFEKLKAQGYRAVDVRNITIEFARHDLARLLQFLEDRAIKTENYFEVRQAVLFSEMIRDQARSQGF